MILGDDPLTFVRIEVVEVTLGDGLGAMLPGYLVHHGDRRLCQDGDRRHHQFKFLAGPWLVQHQQGLIFPGQQHIPETPLDKAGGGTTGTGVQHLHVLEQVANELPGPLFATALLQGIAPGGQVVPARPTGRLGVRCDDGDILAHQIVPVLYLLRIALAHQEDDGRGVGRGIVGQPPFPVASGEARLGHRIHVIGQRQGDHVGLQSVHHGARLLAGAAV